MTRDIINEFKVSDEDAAAQVSAISTIEGHPVWALFIEYADHKLKIRIRSKGPVINEFAKKYNGVVLNKEVHFNILKNVIKSFNLSSYDYSASAVLLSSAV